MAYLVKKIMYSVFVLWGVVTAIFFLFNVLPGDPAAMILGQRGGKEAVEAIHRDLGIDKPVITRYANYLNDLSPLSAHNCENTESYWYLDQAKYSAVQLFGAGNKCVVLKLPYLRRSYLTRRPVADIIRETLPETVILAVTAIALASFFGISLGVLCAVKKDSFFDRAVFTTATVFGISAPSFLVGLVLAWLFGYVLGPWTGLPVSGSLYDLDVWEGEVLRPANLVLPAVTLGIRPLSLVIQLTRNSMLDVLSQDYIRTARAKGLSNGSVIFRHALRNALNPVVTALSGWLAALMAGAVFVEKIFGWKGIGNEVVEALNNNDLPVVMGATLIFACIFVGVNLLVDMLYVLLDPRVKMN